MKILQVMCLGFMCMLMSIATAQDRFKVTGDVTYHGKPVEDCKILLFEENEQVDQKTTSSKGHFTFHLHEDKLYTLETHRGDFMVKRVQINTKMLGKHLPHIAEHKLNFNIHLEHMPDHMDAQQKAELEELEFPFAILVYDEESKNFKYDHGYSREMREMEKDVIHEHEHDQDKAEK